MKLEALQTLVTVVSRGTFAAAAADIGITAGAVSLQMKQLETWFGRPLFDRSGRAVSATPLAVEISTVAARLLTDLHRFRVRQQPSVAGVVRLGVIATVQTSALPIAIRVAQTVHEGLDIRLSLATSGPLLTSLNAGEIDAAIVVRPRGGGSSRLAWHGLVREPFVLVAPESAPERSALQALRAWPWIRYDTSLTGGRTASRFVRRLCPGVSHAFEVADTDAIVAMVAEGLGVSVIPRPRPAIRNGHAIREIALGPRGPMRSIALACRRLDADSRRIAAIQEVFQFAYSNLGSGAP